MNCVRSDTLLAFVQFRLNTECVKTEELEQIKEHSHCGRLHALHVHLRDLKREHTRQVNTRLRSQSCH